MSGPLRPSRDPADVALDLLALAHEVQAGRVVVPRNGVGPTRVEGKVVVPTALHRLICGWHVATRWEPVDGQLDVVECHGCGLLRPAEDPVPRLREPRSSPVTPACGEDAEVVRLRPPRRRAR